MLADGAVVVHISDGRVDCSVRDHGVVDSRVPAANTYDGKERPEWVGVVWRGGDQVRHPSANLHLCTCAADQ